MTELITAILIFEKVPVARRIIPPPPVIFHPTGPVDLVEAFFFFFHEAGKKMIGKVLKSEFSRLANDDWLDNQGVSAELVLSDGNHF